jgi:hypothetical protein
MSDAIPRRLVLTSITTRNLPGSCCAPIQRRVRSNGGGLIRLRAVQAVVELLGG